MPRRFAPPDGWVVQGFSFAIDPTDEQLAIIARFFGARRKAYNWALEQIKAGIDAYHATGVESERPSLYGLRKRWNAERSAICVNTETGEVWWPEVSKEVFANGIAGAVEAYWRWQGSRSGTIAGRRVGFPRYKKRGKDRDRCSFTTGTMRLEHDRRHLTLPRLGTFRTHENTRKIERLVASGRARIVSVTLSRRGTRIVVSVTLSRRGTRIVAAVQVAASRPQRPGVAEPSSVVGVDVGMRRLATVATAQQVIAVVDNRRPGEPRRQLRYKCAWYGSTLVEADRFFPSSKTCQSCGHLQDIGWSEHWSCEACKAEHQRDDNAAINLAKAASLGAVGAPVKRGAEHKTGPRPAAGEDTRKGGSASAEPNNSVRSAA